MNVRLCVLTILLSVSTNTLRKDIKVTERICDFPSGWIKQICTSSQKGRTRKQSTCLRVLFLLPVACWHTCVKPSAGDMCISNCWQTGSEPLKCEDTHAVVVIAESLTLLVAPHPWLPYFYHLSGKTGATKSHPESGCVPNCAPSKY